MLIRFSLFAFAFTLRHFRDICFILISYFHFAAHAFDFADAAPRSLLLRLRRWLPSSFRACAARCHAARRAGAGQRGRRRAEARA